MATNFLNNEGKVCPAKVLQGIPVISNKIMEYLPMTSLHACARYELFCKLYGNKMKMYWDKNLLSISANKFIIITQQADYLCCYCRVCRIWNDIVKSIKQKRKDLKWICIQGTGMEDQQVQTISSELMLLFEVVELTIVSLSIRRKHWKFDIAFPRALSLITIAFDVIYPQRSDLHV